MIDTIFVYIHALFIQKMCLYKVRRRTIGDHEALCYNAKMMKKKKLICASLALLLAGCSTTQKATMEDLYSNISLDAGFDTVLYYQEYNSDTEASKAHFEEVVSLFSHYNELFDIYNDYEGVSNIKTINDFAGVSPVVVDPVIIEMLNEAKSAVFSKYGTTTVKKVRH